MCKSEGKVNSARYNAVLFVVVTIFIFAVGGCSTTPTTTGPGAPDEMQLEHYEMVKSAIDSKSRTEALAALALLQADVSRWRTNSLDIMKAFVDLGEITDAVNKEDWDLAYQLFNELTMSYRNS
jgi:hypothetical protein